MFSRFHFKQRLDHSPVRRKRPARHVHISKRSAIARELEPCRREICQIQAAVMYARDHNFPLAEWPHQRVQALYLAFQISIRSNLQRFEIILELEFNWVVSENVCHSARIDNCLAALVFQVDGGLVLYCRCPVGVGSGVRDTHVAVTGEDVVTPSCFQVQSLNGDHDLVVCHAAPGVLVGWLTKRLQTGGNELEVDRRAIALS